MDKKLMLGIGIGVALCVMLVLSIIGVASLIGSGPADDTVESVAIDSTPVVEGADPDPAAAIERSDSRLDAGNVVVNGRALTSDEIRQLEQQYGARPVPGDYWYDPRSGLYGAAGMAPAGFMRAGHDFGPLPAEASGGSTGVFVNGRDIPYDEYMVLNTVWGTYVQPGRYWLDEYGNVGLEGLDIPVANLFLQIQARIQAGIGGAGGGDNIWSSRFGAGNYTPDNSAGYVSVPGHGPIGYGN